MPGWEKLYVSLFSPWNNIVSTELKSEWKYKNRVRFRLVDIGHVCTNKTGTSKVGAISKAQKSAIFLNLLKGGPFRLFENPVCCKISKKLRGDPLETFKKYKNFFGNIFEKKRTRRERLKSALYLRLKKRKVFYICSGRIHEKL